MSSRTSGPPQPQAGLRVLMAAWRRGFPAFCAAAGLTPEAAAELAVHLRLVPASRLLTAERVAELAQSRHLPNTALARRWRVSRWTVAAWRKALHLERIAQASAVARTTTPTLVRSVEIHPGDRLRLVNGDREIQLGRSARTLLSELVAHHPMPVQDERLRRAMFADVPTERAQAALLATVSRLRRHLPAGTIVREEGSYRLAIPVSAVHQPGQEIVAG